MALFSTIGKVAKKVVPFINPAAQTYGEYLRSKAAGKATATYTGGIDSASGTINQNSAQLSTLNAQALANQKKILDPYNKAGTNALGQLTEGTQPGGSLIKPFQFNTEDLLKDPGYQFRLAEGQKILQRGANANLNRFSGGTLKAAQRYQQDYASQEFSNAYNREENTFRENQQSEYSRLKDMTGIGETAAGRGVIAETEFANRETANKVLTSQQIASLQQEKALAEAEGNIEKSNGIAKMIETGVAFAGPVLELLGITGLAATAAPISTGVLTAAGATAATNLAATAGVGIPSVSTATTTAAGGGFGSTLAGLATNPITIAVAGALAVGAMWLKSQAHWEANTAVKDFENPFAQQSLAPFAAEWDKAVKAGTMTRDVGTQALQQYRQNFEDYAAKITQWAGNSSDKKKVATQSINNLWNQAINAQIQRMTREIAAMEA